MLGGNGLNVLAPDRSEQVTGRQDRQHEATAIRATSDLLLADRGVMGTQLAQKRII
ncbi:MAG: hypothetical protein H0V17_21935 [Deltaproteobacteria bacterium]|nr:hypothetical protein [Deltaproteobacteria bacterium]